MAIRAFFNRISRRESPQLQEPEPVSQQQVKQVKTNTIKEVTMRAIINGKLVNLPNGATVEELRAKLPEIGNDDVMEEGFGGTKPLKENEAIKEGAKVWTVPKIVKG